MIGISWRRKWCAQAGQQHTILTDCLGLLVENEVGSREVAVGTDARQPCSHTNCGHEFSKSWLAMVRAARAANRPPRQASANSSASRAKKCCRTLKASELEVRLLQRLRAYPTCTSTPQKQQQKHIYRHIRNGLHTQRRTWRRRPWWSRWWHARWPWWWRQRWPWWWTWYASSAAGPTCLQRN
jgi:hypothetical protein